MKNQSIAELAKTSFEGDNNCAQATLMALAEAIKLDIGEAEALTSGLGGGMGGHQEVCGAVSGAAIGVGYAVFKQYGTPIEGKDASRAAVGDLIDRFKSEYGTARCFELTNCDFRNEEEKARFAESGQKDLVCKAAILRALELAVTIIEGHEAP